MDIEKQTMGLNEIFIYRITHIENIPYIIKHGISHKNHWNANPDYKSIGDESLIINRSVKEIKVDNGEYNRKAEFKTIRLGDYIPFYFGVRMPMLYVIQNGGNFVQNPTSAENIIYLACMVQEVIHHCNEFYFSDGHGTDKMTTFYDKNHIQQLPDILDWQAIKSKYWGGRDNLIEKRKKQAEFLVKNSIPPQLLYGYACYNEEAKKKLISFGVDEGKIKIASNAYF